MSSFNITASMTYELKEIVLYTFYARLAMSSDAFFGKGRGSRNSHEMRLFGMPGMVLLISPSLRTDTSNIRIIRG